MVIRSRCVSRRFAASATEGESDVLTKIPPDDRIPATIITGFLGSGKTTLLNHILTADHGKYIAVIENEYGEVDTDGFLVAAKAAGAEDIIMLNNGCLCCTVWGDLVRMIGELVEKNKGKFDHIVIETTGLANPASIIQTFYAEDQIFNDVKLDGVVTLVDAKHANFHLDDKKPKGVVNEAVEQIAYADRIIVNKIDLVGDSEVSSLVQRIKNINGMAYLKRAEYGKVDLDYVLGVGGFDLERIESVVNFEGSEDHHHAQEHNHHHDHHHEHDHEHHHHSDSHSHVHTHDPGVSFVSIVCEGNLDLEKANMWLGTLLMDRSDDIYRMKGLLSVNAAMALDVLNFTPLHNKPIRIMYSIHDPSISISGVANIFIKNLDKTIGNKELHEIFCSFGNILSCKVAIDAFGQSKGYGFVQFEQEEAVQNAINRLNGMLVNDKPVYVGPFVHKQERESSADKTRFCNVFVKNLSE